jgi:hypothetical protein
MNPNVFSTLSACHSHFKAKEAKAHHCASHGISYTVLCGNQIMIYEATSPAAKAAVPPLEVFLG